LCKGACGRIEMFDWDGNLIWEYENIDSYTSIHNDFEVMPNGNILMTYWRAKTREEALQAGCMEELIHPKDNNKLTGSVIEVKPIYPKGGEIVWQWHAWDHLIQDYDPSKDNYGNVSQHPELIDINIPVLSEPTWPFLEYDQLHINAIDYNPDLDQILICPRNLNEILVIDHNTTTEEAAGHYGGRYEKGGDILYRWGNPRNYDRGNESDQQLFAQHDAQWISPDCPGAGNIILYNNGFGRPGEDYSSIVEFVPPVDDNGSYILEDNCSFGPKEPVWEYKSSNPELFYSAYASGCQRLPNGNTFICSGTKGTFYEVTSDKEVVWKHMSRFPFPLIDFNIVFKAQHVGADFPGLKI